MSVSLTYRDFTPVKFGTDFNIVDPCNKGFTRTYCQPVKRTETTPFQVEVSQSGTSFIPATVSWTVGANWVALNNTVTHTAGSTATAALNAFVTSGNVIRVLFTISGRTAGEITITVGGISNTYGANQSEVFVLEASSANVVITPTSAFDGVVTITAVEDINDFAFGTTNYVLNGTFSSSDDWSLGTDWSIAAGVASKAAGASIGAIAQAVTTSTQTVGKNPNIYVDKLYKVVYTISNRTAGGIYVSGGSFNNLINWGQVRSTNATFTDYVVIRDNGASDVDIGFSGQPAFDGDLDDVEIYEIANTRYRIEDCDGITVGTILDEDIARVSDTLENITVDWDTLGINGWQDQDFDSPLSTGVPTSVVAFELNDTLADFTTDGVEDSMIVINVTAGTYTIIDVFESSTRLTLTSDIFPNITDTYEIYIWKGSDTALTGGINIISPLAIFTGGAAATHTTLSQDLTSSVGDTYIIKGTFSGITTGEVDIGFSGDTTQITANGDFEISTTKSISSIPTLSATDETFDGSVTNLQALKALADDCYKICTDTWDGSVWTEDKCSECFCLADEHPCTQLFTFTNNEDLGLLDYTYPIIFKQRLLSDVINPLFPIDIENEKDNIGVISTIFGEQEEIPVLNIDDAPKYVHQWIAIMLIHDTWTIDGIQYKLEPGEDYNPIWRSTQGVLKLSMARVEVKTAIQPNINFNG